MLLLNNNKVVCTLQLKHGTLTWGVVCDPACLADQHWLGKCICSDLLDGSVPCPTSPFLSHIDNTCSVASASILEWNNHVSLQVKSGSDVRWVQGLSQDQASDITTANFIPFRTLRFYTPS